MRLLPSGEPDPRFGTDGVAPTAGRYLQSRLWLYFTDGAVTDSHIYLAGVGTQPRDDSRHAIVARLNLDGNPDPTFSNDGLATRRVSPVFSSEMTQRRIGLLGGSVVVDESGRATVGTTGKEGENLTFTLSRFLGGDGQGLQLTCGGKPATVQGTPGDDVLEAGAITAAGAGDDVIHGGGGLICAGEGNDSVEGRAQEVNLGPGDDLIRNKQIRRDPLVLGGSGDDRVLGRFDRAFGGPGDDLIDTTWPKDRGFYLETSSLAGGPGRDRIKSGEGRDLLMGGDGPDLLGSGADEDSLLGGGGRDSLFGGAGADRLIGGPGWDELEGGDPGPRYRRYYVDTPKAKGLLEVLPGKIARAQARFLQGCVGPPEIRSFWRESSELEEATIRNGRFRESRFEDYPNPFGAEEWSREILRGEIRRDSVRLEIAITDRSEGLECRTGKLRVTFNRIADLRQVEAQ
jgi:Ca2+-binding RTX toxin-like protein